MSKIGSSDAHVELLGRVMVRLVDSQSVMKEAV